jgi:hypothetical protein
VCYPVDRGGLQNCMLRLEKFRESRKWRSRYEAILVGDVTGNWATTMRPGAADTDRESGYAAATALAEPKVSNGIISVDEPSIRARTKLLLRGTGQRDGNWLALGLGLRNYGSSEQRLFWTGRKSLR